ncbi:DnaJ domain protein [Salmonella enterica subsp. enterica]|uniref:DnaJ domain protein n=1 Tax=Salmonella enterica I TaxID=59201 RepID=A0A379UMK0_SALET|nr:DnaJ domain protein [Salmonella enterica subsp. enterica]
MRHRHENGNDLAVLLALLAQRLNWQPQEADDDAEGEELEAFLETVKRGDAFDLLSLAKLPPCCSRPN